MKFAKIADSEVALNPDNVTYVSRYQRGEDETSRITVSIAGVAPSDDLFSNPLILNGDVLQAFQALKEAAGAQSKFTMIDGHVVNVSKVGYVKPHKGSPDRTEIAFANSDGRPNVASSLIVEMPINAVINVLENASREMGSFASLAPRATSRV
jgi:hypothetical protein